MGRLFGSSREMRIAAWHEAHHAGARVALGGKLNEVWIDNRGLGAVDERHTWFGPNLTGRSANLRYIIAGSLGEAWYTGESLEQALSSGDGVKGSDFDWVRRLIGKDSLDKWERKTKRLLSGHKRGISDLVEALLDIKNVDGAQAARILNGQR